MARVRSVQHVIVQVARTLSENLSDWTTLDWLEFDRYDEGADQVIGWAGFHAAYGRRTEVGHPTPEIVGLPQVLGVPAPAWLPGRLIRVLVEDEGGDVEIGGVEYTMGWVGPVVSVEVMPDAGDDESSGGLVQVVAVGPGAMLDQVVIRTGSVVTGNGDTVVNPGYCPRFNALPNGDHVLFGGSHAHELNDQSVTDFWTARQVLEYLLDGMGGSIAWTISDPDACLDYEVETCSFHGWTVFQALLFLTVRRGLTFHLRPLGEFVTILIRSTSAEAISVGGFTLPASSVTAYFDLRGDVWFSQPVLSFDHSSVYDVIVVEGACPLIGMTPRTWEYGWAGSEETAWEENSQASGTENVHRLFRIGELWYGANNGGANGLRSRLLTETSEAYGENGLTGEREYTGSSEFPPAHSLVIEPFIPWSESFGYELAGERAEPVVVVRVEPIATAYTDATQELGWGVTVLGPPAAVRLLDNANGSEIASYTDFSADHELFVTLGIREPAPLQVSWRRPQAEWPRLMPREKTVQVPGFEQWIVLANTVTGVNEDGTLRTLAVQRTIRDDLPRMRALLALLRAQYAEPSTRMTLTDRGRADVSAYYRPGTLVTEVITGSAVLEPQGVITRRSVRRLARQGVQMYDTEYATEQRGPDMEAVL